MEFVRSVDWEAIIDDPLVAALVEAVRLRSDEILGGGRKRCCSAAEATQPPAKKQRTGEDTAAPMSSGPAAGERGACGTRGRCRVLLCGAWDLFHYGHVHALSYAKFLFPNASLVVGVHNDKTTERTKGKVVLTMAERASVVRGAKYVDEVITDCPLVITLDFLAKNNLDYMVAAEEDQSFYAEIASVNKLALIPKLEGVSTTAILTRIVSNYDAFIDRTLNCGEKVKDLRLGLIKSVQIRAKRRISRFVKSVGANWKISGLTIGFGERFLRELVTRGIAKEMFLLPADNEASYPGKGVREEVPEELADMLPTAFEQCTKLVKGWESLQVSDITVKVVTGGLTNKLYKVSLTQSAADRIAVTLSAAPEDAQLSVVPHHVLLRIYGIGTEVYLDREKEHVIFRHFSETGLGPYLHGFFPGGRVEEFLELQDLSTTDLRVLHTAIAQQLANVHLLDMAELPHTPVVFEKLHNWYKAAVSTSFDDPAKAAMVEALNLPALQDEIAEVEGALLKLHSPVLFCHNDLIGGNIMYNDASKRICFIDFEYGSYNHRGFDFGNHFCEWSLYYRLDEWPHFRLDPASYPTLQQQRDFATTYLRTIKEKANPAAVDDAEFEADLQSLLAEANGFALASHLLWTCWSVMQAATSDIKFGYLEYAQARLADYYRRKEDLLYRHEYGRDYIVSASATRLAAPSPQFEEHDRHQFVESRFHIPTWCQHCTFFVVSPFGKQGYSCQACGMRVHKNCKDLVTTKCVARKKKVYP
eukprot:TRINITY_DN1559_c0_g1_i3.p1 TRINITY_DN1559_c0_g1~~TRINITY_DN1559_c0_g1_i3.p1  ORF type:complete len:766 (-),score=187.23 TRINITY_DN1559_c0_g1_i3:860-3133(-)